MQNWIAEKIEPWPIEKLIPSVRNARTHSEVQVGQIAASIQEFGFTNPVLIGDDGSLVAGHGRLLAAHKLGITQVPVVVLSHLTATQRRLLMLADNKIAENAAWDDDLLQAEISALLEEGANLGLTGFDADEVDKMLAGMDALAGQTDEDLVPEPEENPVSVLGDIWICGDHVVGCLDCTQPESYGAIMGTDQATMMFTDPPYNIGMGDYATTFRHKIRGEKSRPIQNDNLGEKFGAFLESFLKASLQHVEGGCYVSMSADEMSALQAAFLSAGGSFKTWIIWVKQGPTLGNADYQRQYEPFLYGYSNQGKRYWCGARDQRNVWNFNRPTDSKLHPTMKPVELVEKAVSNSSRVGDVVLDPFGGSGTTMIACQKRSRKARLMELDPRYVDVIVRRWCEYTGEDAKRQSDGLLFSDALLGKAQEPLQQTAKPIVSKRPKEKKGKAHEKRKKKKPN